MLMRITSRQRRGVVAVIAMLFLVLFASLAVGLYTASATNAIVSTNEKNGTISLTAAETGMDFVRYNLGKIRIPPATPPDQVFTYVADHLQDALEGTGNLGNNRVAVAGNTITIPANPNAFIKVDNSGAEFRATLEKLGSDIRVKTTGRYINASASNRAVQMDYAPTTVNTTVYNYAVAAQGGVIMERGTISATGGAENSIASVMSIKPSLPAIRVSGGIIGGDLNITAPNLALVTGGFVGGTNIIAQIIKQHTHVVEAPDFPYVDSSYFKPFAVN